MIRIQDFRIFEPEPVDNDEGAYRIRWHLEFTGSPEPLTLEACGLVHQRVRDALEPLVERKPFPEEADA